MVAFQLGHLLAHKSCTTCYHPLSIEDNFFLVLSSYCEKEIGLPLSELNGTNIPRHDDQMMVVL